jgi:hypothetical protein
LFYQEDLVERITKHWNDMLENESIDEERGFYFKPKFSAPNDDTVVVGMKLWLPLKHIKIPEDI